MAQVVSEQGWQRNTQLAAAMARWEDIAGPEVAAHVVAESFTDGVLTLRADSTAWATQLRMLLPTLRERIDAAVGQGVVADINVQGPHRARQRGAWRVKGRGPRDTYG
jgi:predicted nucleic acid-binding Zn ribbon protein